MKHSSADSLHTLSAIQLAALANRERNNPGNSDLLLREPIAIVGLSHRFPVGDIYRGSPDGFWQMLVEGGDAVGRIPAERWDAEAHYDPDRTQKGKCVTRHGAFLEDIRGFDAGFFNISGHEAARMDPQQRLLLELVWQALESAGTAPSSLSGTKTGIFAAIASTEYAHDIIRRGDLNLIDSHYGSGNAISFVAGRLAYLLNTKGPAVTLDTACSSSLVALAQASRSLKTGECDRAVVGAAHLMTTPGAFTYLSHSGALSPNGRCKAFDASADGFGRGEGGAVVVLKRLSDAIRDNDLIQGLIRGSAVNHDGASGGVTVPNGLAQTAVIQDALRDASLDPGQIDYVEAHGTGTLLGDPIELNALGRVFAKDREQPLAVGTVKNNVGHLEAAAGLCGLAKLLLALRWQCLPPHAGFSRPNPHVSFEDLGLRILGQAEVWPRSDRPRRAGLSGFGLSGTNAHIVVEEAPFDPRPRRNVCPPPYLICLSAKSEAALRQLTASMADMVSHASGSDLVDVCFSNNAGRDSHSHRLSVLAEDAAALRTGLDNAATEENSVLIRRSQTKQRPQIAFLFTGQGAASAGMAKGLYDTHPLFRRELDRCADILAPHLDKPLTEILFPQPGTPDCLTQTAYAQPALAAVMWSLAELWRAMGVTPDAVLGHSLGEYVAAAVAGMVKIEELLPFIAARGRLMQSLPAGGVMVSLTADRTEIERALDPLRDRVSIAAFNGPGQTVLAGWAEAVDQVLSRLGDRAGSIIRLNVSHAFHSPQMEGILDELAGLAGQLSWQPSAIPLISNVTGLALPAGETLGPDLIVRHARAPVRFEQGMQGLWERDCRIFVEIGPKPVLSALGRGCLPAKDAVFLPSLAAPRADWACLQEAARRLWHEGAPINWTGLYRGFDLRRRPQPAYPFEHQYHWLEDTSPMTQPLPQSEAPAPQSFARILPELVEIFATILGDAPERIDPTLSLLELGADSILIGEAVRAVEARFSLRLEMKDLYGPLSTIEAISQHISANTPLAPARTLAQPEVSTPASSVAGNLTELFQQQLRTMEGLIQRQLDVLAQSPIPAKAEPPVPTSNPNPNPKPIIATPAPAQALGPYQPPRMTEAQSEVNAVRDRFIAELADRLNRRTRISKGLADEHRPHLADSRASAGFRPSMKELIYPVVGDRSQGCRIWDVDGNEYVDISMDFGANLFGHRAPVVLDAVQAQLDQGTALAPRASHLTEAAERLCRLTQMDRVVFCQSGTEAVMTSVRIARLVTSRPHVVIFSKSYHGHSDGLLATTMRRGDHVETVPAAKGIVEAAVAEVTILDYNSPIALNVIRELGSNLAAVLVEPVQSRALEVRPGGFLRSLRQLTRELGALLIFDEMITGFRLHPGGAQAYFGVQADLATYGKALGGGIQVAALAGRGRLLDGIDGGCWQYGDRSAPTAPTTFFAGTFNGNPLATAAAAAVLRELERRGPDFQKALNEKTRSFVAELNTWLEAEQVALRLIHFGSLFRFTFRGDMDLIFPLLMERGVFVWEGRNCFLSEAHDDEALAFVADQIKDAVRVLKAAGLATPNDANRPLPVTGIPEKLSLTDAQRQIRLVDRLDGAAAQAYVDAILIEVDGEIDPQRLTDAAQQISDRHEALRTTFPAEGNDQLIWDHMPIELSVRNSSDFDSWYNQAIGQKFDLQNGPLLRLNLLRLPDGTSRILVISHHIVVDGWSLGVVVNEILSAYGDAAALSPQPPRQFRDHLAWLDHGRSAQERAADVEYWRRTLAEVTEDYALPGDRPKPASWSWRGATHRVTVPKSLQDQLKALGARTQATLYTVMMASWLSYLHRVADKDDLVIGFLVLGRAPEDQGDMVGFATNLVPFRSKLSPNVSFKSFLNQTAQSLREAQQHANYPLASIVKDLGLTWRAGHMPLISSVLNMDRPKTLADIDGISARVGEVAQRTAKVELNINILDLGEGLAIDFIYATDLYSPAYMAELAEGWMTWLRELGSDEDCILARKVPALTPARPVMGEDTAPVRSPRQSVPASDEIEAKILANWAELLGLDDLGVTEDFFELGGDSLMADEAVMWARRSFNVEIPLGEMFKTPTVAGLARVVKKQNIPDPGPAAQPAKSRIQRQSRDKYRVARPRLATDASE
ncbi:aminotransferase class III-fold pyridoxal phosphate-dependent enzyme [Rhodospirillum sp. A1_3_36]|uniref:aminotransferase class III-fold pyridoxal phosphate-dependent enzyme n=1 Tax=Rhodospirillum sp. A1_3_36 TaxID=3391666 RepID=UPI0039A58F52